MSGHVYSRGGITSCPVCRSQVTLSTYGTYIIMSCVCLCVRVCPRVFACVRHDKFTDSVSLQIRYVYKTKQNNDCKFTDTLCLQNKANKTGRKN